jgi:PPOX class probable FMN-dependent enzyme
MPDGDPASPPHIVRDEATLQRLYGAPSEASLAKEVDHVHPLYRAFIEAAPFVAIATGGSEGLDVSPRGDGPGFVTVADEKTLLIPDRRGNNRADTLRNVIRDPRIALLFLVPGIGETLRVNGRAEVSIEPTLLERFAAGGKPARSVLVVHVETVFFQCSRAVVRADLWNPAKQLPRSALPSTGTILGTLSGARVGGASYDEGLEERVKASLY